MPYLNNTSNIPGMMLQFKDGGLSLREEQVPISTKSVLLLGTAIDGPVMNPVAVDSLSSEAVFGKSVDISGKVNGSSLPEAFQQLWKEGCRDIRIMRATGSVASVSLSGGNVSSIEQLKSGEELGVFGGNQVINKTLSFPIVPDSLSVKTKKANRSYPLVSSKYTVNNDTGVFGIAANKIDSGVDILASYKYYKGNVAKTEQTTSLLATLTETTPTNFSYGNVENDATVRMQVSANDSDNHIIKIETTKPVGATLEISLDDGHDQLTSTDATILWGLAPTGFPLISGYDVTTNIKVKADKGGNYSIVVKLVNLVSDEIIVQKTIAITAVETTVTNESIITASANTLVDIVKTLDSAPIEIDGKVQFAFMIGGINIDGQLLSSINSLRDVGSKLVMSDLYTLVDDVLTIKASNIVHKDIKLGAAILASYYFLESDVEQEASIDIETSFGGSVYNQTMVEVRVSNGIKELVVTKPDSKKANSTELPLVFSCSTYPTFGSLVNAINNEASGIFKASTLFVDTDSDTLVEVQTHFEDGDDGVNITKQQLFEALSGKRLEDGSFDLNNPGAYQLLQNYKVDYIIPVGAFANELLLIANDNFAYELALVCAKLSQVHMTHGVISMKAPKKTDLSSLENYVKELEAYDNTYLLKGQDGSFITDADGNPYDVGCYISVIAGPEVVVNSPRMGTYTDCGVTKYAAFLSRRKVSSAPTNKKIDSISGLRFQFSVPQLGRLATKRFVTFKNRMSDNAVVYTDGVTSALPNSDYSRIVNIDVVRSVIDDVYAAAEPFIGEPPSLSNNNALSTAIDKKLLLRSDPVTGDISGYGFNIVNNSGVALIGDSQIELTLTPLGERKSITIVVGLKPAV